ncbi:TIGR04104 family putative zinc finger protein [Ornithinibacillus salinisoli]|uniref:TIGR04104 family putative zinc finger protein n=1 Tax=Ornithinibacillus salinisoli TaxID=1848459 RepID=A0ABW4VXV3_9BACI
MQKCEKCHTPFTWIEIFKCQWAWGEKNNLIYCKTCDTEHKLIGESKIITNFFMIPIIILVIYLINMELFSSFFIYLLVSFLAYGVVSTLFPFFYRFQSKYHTNYRGKS